MSNSIKFIHKGDFSNIERFFHKVLRKDYLNIMEKYGKLGVSVLSAATPVDSGVTASSWNYEIVGGSEQSSIVWTNSNENKGVNIAIILQYGHATKNGGYVQGLDYINPAMKPIFENMAKDVWREVIL